MTILESGRPSISLTNIYSAVRSAAFSLASRPEAPARIRAAVDQYEAQSERIVGWVQLAGVLVFAALYAATYATFDVHHAIEPVPVALALYGAFTIWRLRCAYTGRLSTFQQYASAAIDILVLVALIASFPSQYGESAALYLKAPTLFYVFILIGLRALRFDPAQVLFTGFAAALGWGALTIWAAIDGAPLTGDYRIYMSSLSLLPGAEMEKIAAMLATTLLLALGVDRARTLLFRTATEEAAAEDLSKFVGRDAADRIRASRDGVRSGDGEVRRAAIMFVDLRGFTMATKELPPRDVIALLKDYQARLLPVIERGGGSVDKFMGDGILVSFGAARATGQECAEAIETALAVTAEIDRWKADRVRSNAAPLDVGVALAEGEIVYGAIGHGERLEYTVIGDAVNLAAKLEKHAKVERARIIATASLVKRAGEQGYPRRPVRMVDAAAVDGASGPVDLAVLG
ncbi:MAG: adenylate/guanylate cyclase domain-containing protein [Pseudomonadota bacterium]